jgi:hypothetical protein
MRRMSEQGCLARWCGIGLCQGLVRMALVGVGAGPLVLLSPTWAMAQEGSRATATAASAPHRFFDVKNVALTGIESGALLADGIFTQRALRKYPEFFREADPIARPFVMRGWPGQIAGGALFVSADVGLRYSLHRKNHHRLERLLPLVLTVYGTIGAIHGARELRRVEGSIVVLAGKAAS